VKRAFFLILATLSAILFAATLVLWPHGYRANSKIVWRSVSYDGHLTDWTFVSIDSAAGYVCFSPWRHRVEPVNWFRFERPVARQRMFDWVWSGDRPLWPGFSGPDYGGIQFRHFTEPYTPPQVYEGWAITLPYWLVTPLLALLPTVVALQLFKRQRRRAHGLCPVCGYDLRASPDRCPECGALAAMRPAA
jgi:hypothetical protein